MDDFVELGIEGVDKLVDKHFDKVPDSALHAHTYHPKNLSRSHRQRRRESIQESSRHSSRSDSDSDPERYSSRRSNMSSKNRDPTDPPAPLYPLPSQYSREPPRLRTEYLPPSTDRSHGRRQRDLDENYHSDSHRAPARRPKAVTRRSSSYHGPRTRRSSSSSEDRSNSRDSMSHRDAIKDKSRRYGLKDETIGRFTKSPAGVTGGVMGGLVGAWAAQKAQIMTGRDQRASKTDQAGNKALSALGAAVGALAVNALINRMEDGKKEEYRKEDKAWENKWGTASDEEDREERKGSGSVASSRHRRDDERRSGRRDSEYRSEKGRRGY